MDLAYNAFNAQKEYRPFDDIMAMPIRALLDWVKYLEPKLKEIQKRQEAERMKQELAGKRGNQHRKRASR